MLDLTSLVRVLVSKGKEEKETELKDDEVFLWPEAHGYLV
jgi:hypothetical protein